MKAIAEDKEGYKYTVTPPEGVTVTKEQLLKQASKLVNGKHKFKIVK